MRINYFKKGFTLVEALVYISILLMVTLVLSEFQRDVFFLNNSIQSNLNSQLDARHLVRIMATELRKTINSATGAYPIESAATSSLSFYSDVDSDGDIDKVRYFLTGSSLRKSVISPVGNPAVYNISSEKITTLMSNIVASSTQPIFEYYSSSYDGNSLPLSSPIDIPSIRLVKITVIIDSDPNRSPIQLIVRSSVSLRNLKDNL